MNDRTKKLIEADKKYVWHPFTQMAGWVEGETVVIDRGFAFFLIDTEGNSYIDGVSSLWCNVHGHGVEEIDEAIKAQLSMIGHSTLLGLGQTRSIELAERLVGISPAGLEKVFYSDSGATSVEIALKMVFQYYRNKGVKGREKFIALKNSYHGDTIGSVSVGGMDLFHGIFGSLLFETYFVPGPHPYRFDGIAEECKAHSLKAVEVLLKEKGDEIAGIIVEPLVQGAAGILVHPAGFLKGVSELAKQYDVKLIVDEVATGFGRTGKMFACEHEGVSPDVMCMAKGITGGYLPLAATMATNDIYEAFLGDANECKTFYHGHTYTGNALGCAAAIASLDLFEKNDIIASLDEKVELIKKRLGEIKELPFVGDVRQCGMMAAVEIVKDKASAENFEYERLIGAKLCRAMWKRGAMMRPLSDVIVLMPPVGIDMPLLGDLLDIVKEAFEKDLPGIVENVN